MRTSIKTYDLYSPNNSKKCLEDIEQECNDIYDQEGVLYFSEIYNLASQNGLKDDDIDELFRWLQKNNIDVTSDDDSENFEINADEEQEYKVVARDMAQHTAINDYLKAINQYPLLTRKQEIELAKRIRQGDKEAKELLIKSNLRLSVYNARKCTHRGVPLMDLIQEGNIGLAIAADKFDYTKGFKFSTYATFWIRQRLTIATDRQSRTIRIPIGTIQLIDKVNKAQRKLEQKLGRKPTNKEIADEANIKLKDVDFVNRLNYEGNPISIDGKIGDEQDSCLGDLIGFECHDYEDKVGKEITDETVKTLMNTSGLTSREKKVIRQWFGLGLDDEKKFAEIAKELGITKERVRQIYKMALDKMKKQAYKLKLHKEDVIV